MKSLFTGGEMRLPEFNQYKEMLEARRKFRDSRTGVASTVGTIMALMVFLAFLSMFTTQYIPLWMQDNEVQYMNQVENDMSRLKSNIDILVVNNVVDFTLYSPITMVSGYVPVFAEPTHGTLTFQPNKGMINVIYNYSYNTSTTPYTPIQYSTNLTGGYISLHAPNRYYVAQTIVYENGAIIVSQGLDKQVITGAPPVTAEKKDIYKNFTIALYSLLGQAASGYAEGTKGIYTSLVYVERFNQRFYEEWNITDNVTIEFQTAYPKAWCDFYNKTFAMHNFTSGVDYTMSTPTLISEGYYKFTITVYNLTDFTIVKSSIKTSIEGTGG
ncbi:MAG: hypothetical protein ACP5LE_00715 [Thermoplasmata archaeon]